MTYSLVGLLLYLSANNMNRITKVLALFLLLLPGFLYGIDKRQCQFAQHGILSLVGSILGWSTQHSIQTEQAFLDVDSTADLLDPSIEKENVEVLIAKVDHQSALDAGRKEKAGKKENEISWQSKRPKFLKITSKNGALFGIPVAQFSNELWLLRNDGAIQRVSRDHILKETITSVPFEPISLPSLVVELRKEFGAGFQVRAEQPYVFVTQSKNASQWVERFRNLNASLKQYSRKYDLNCSSLDFPLIAIVLGSESEFRQYAQAQQENIPSNCAGFYSQRDNRIVLFEDANKVSRQEVLDTICHEAIHQLAFNMGLHKRCSGTPMWLAEGFATIFEAPAYSAPNSDGRSRWPASRKSTCLALLENDTRLYSLVDSLLRNDNVFKNEPELAYAVSWAIAHHLSTNSPREFADYLHQIGQLPSLVDFSAEDRWTHFRSNFKVEMPQLIRQLKNHLRSL
jgi:hypothetical protein